MKVIANSVIIYAMFIFSSAAVISGPSNISPQGMKFTPHLAKPSLKQKPVISRSAAHAKTKKINAKKNTGRAPLAVHKSALKPAGLRRHTSGVQVHRPAPAISTKQHLPVGTSGLGNRFGAGSHSSIPASRGLPGKTGKGGFAPPHRGGFAPVGGSHRQAHSPTGRLNNVMGKRNTSTHRGGFAPSGGRGAASSQNPNSGGQNGSNVMVFSPAHIHGGRQGDNSRSGGSGPQYDGSRGEHGAFVFSDGTSVRATDPSGQRGTVHSDGSISYSDGTRVTHDSESGDTKFVNSDGTATVHSGSGPQYDASRGEHGAFVFSDGTSVRATDPSGKRGTVNPDGSISYSDGTRVTHDFESGDTKLVHPDGTATVHSGSGPQYDASRGEHGAFVFSDGTSVRATDPSGKRGTVNPDGSISYSDGTRVTHDSESGDTKFVHPDGTSTVHSGSSPSGGKHSSPSGGMHGSSSSGGKHSSHSGGTHGSSPSGGKHSSHSGGTHGSSSSGGKHSSHSGGKHSSHSGGKHSSSSSSGSKKPDSGGSSKPDKEQGKGKGKSVIGGGSGVNGGESTRDMYNRLHKPGNADAPANGGHVRGDVSQPGPGSSRGSAKGDEVGGHINPGNTGSGDLSPLDNSAVKSPLNMVDPDRFGGGPVAPANGAADQLRQKGDSVRPGER